MICIAENQVFMVISLSIADPSNWIIGSDYPEGMPSAQIRFLSRPSSNGSGIGDPDQQGGNANSHFERRT